MPPQPSSGLNPPQVITYRHAHSHSIGPQHPLRVIAHCDIDAAYAQFEQVRLGIDPSKPLAVQQWSGLIAINYPARAFGITRHLNFDEAKKKCPELICVHVATYAQGEDETEPKYHEHPRPETHKVSLDPYRRESLKLLKIFGEVSGAVVEKASIDESFFDLSLPVREILLKRYATYLAAPPPGSALGMDTPLPEPPPIDWTGIGEVVPAGEDEGEKTTWSDVALAVGAELMAKCRAQVYEQLKYTCSAGIARNKMLAKLCSAYKKPAAQTILRDCAALSFLRPLKFQKIRFLGGKLGVQLAQATSATTVGDLWTVPLEELQKAVGETEGMWVWEITRGVDGSEVEMKKETKSMLSSKNFASIISTWAEGLHWLRVLSTELLGRLHEARENTPGVWPKTIVLHRRNDSFVSTAKQTAFPYTSRLTLDYVFRHAQRLLVEFVPPSTAHQNRLSDMTDATPLGRTTSLALAFQGLERVETGQKGIEGFFAPGPAPSPAVEHDHKGKRKASPDVASDATPKRSKATESPAEPDLTYTCPRCKKVLRVSPSSILSSPTRSRDAVVASALDRVKAEHADGHFARDLVDEERKALRPAPQSVSSKPAVKSKKEGAKPQKPKGDIASFFKPSTSASSSKSNKR